MSYNFFGLKGTSWFAVLFLPVFLLSTSVQAQEVLELGENPTRIELGPKLQILEDAEGNLGINEVASEAYSGQFLKPEKGVPAYGFTNSTYWARVSIRNKHIEKRTWWLEFDYPLADELELYIERKEGGMELKVAGDQRPFYDREMQVPTFVFAIDLHSGEEINLYLKQRTSSTLTFPLILWSPASYTEYVGNSKIYLGLFYGIMMVMLLYNLFLYFSLRVPTYLYYILAILSIIMFQATMNGLSFMYIWPDLVWWNSKAVAVSLGFVGVTLLTFTRHFLGLASFAPKLDRLLLILTIADGGNIILALTLPYSVSIKIGIVFGLSIILVSFATGIIIWRKGFKPARFFLLAWTTFLIGMFLQALRAMGVLPTNFVTSYSSQIGSVLEVILLSIALADRINTMQETIKDQELEQERMLRTQEEEKKALIERQKVDLEHQVEERTRELKERNEEVEEKNKQLADAFEEIAEINRKTVDSIKYAQRIQQAIIPNTEKLKKGIPNHFIIYQPRDIVSGDFYWASMVKTRFVLILADCTGHGVPGALMSMIGNSILDQIVIENQVTTPSQILLDLHEGVQKFLKQDQEGSSSTRDGMDLSVVTLDFRERKLFYAGAKSSLIYSQHGHLSEIRGDKYTIAGGQQRHHQVSFTNHELSLEPGLSIYLYTDGFVDQFGGNNDKRFSKRRLRELVQECEHLPIETQRERFEMAFLEWKGNASQLDDVSLIGVKF